MNRQTGRIEGQLPPSVTAEEVIRGVDLRGRRAIVTGGASGIGQAIAGALVGAGAQVVIAGRNTQAGDDAANRINAAAGADLATADLLDLGSLESVRDFARRRAGEPLDLLINNAGVMACPLGWTIDGFETHMGVNHLGHFLLASLLTPSLRRGVRPRVVALSSAGHRFSDIVFDDLHYRARDYDAIEAYGQSKSANALFAVGFDKRFKSEGIRAFSVDPGGVATSLIRHMTDELYQRMGAVPVDRRPPGSLKRPEQGAATAVWAAVAPELDEAGGLYLQDCAEAPLFGPEQPRGVMPHAIDEARAERLWTVSGSEVRL